MSKRNLKPLFIGACFSLCTITMPIFAAEQGIQNYFISSDTTWESEHPPLSESTKKAIADYKKKPTEENKQALFEALNESYDWVIQNKKNNLEIYKQERTDKINYWLKSIINGDMPPFMLLSTENNKGEWRQAVADAVEVYRVDSNDVNKELVKQSLENYYDAFLKEQEEHIIDTENERETRIAVSLAYFTSELFNPSMGMITSVDKEDVLAEIICAYISSGAEIVPVNPEARVRERQYNASIKEAQFAYIDNPTSENRAILEEKIKEAFQAALDFRIEEFEFAEDKGNLGGQNLLSSMFDSNFIDSQYLELTEQKNLYGRIDRMITFGSNTCGDWTPRMIEESQELAELLKLYHISKTEESKLKVEAKFYEIYEYMMVMQNTHLEDSKNNIDIYVANTLDELTSTVHSLPDDSKEDNIQDDIFSPKTFELSLSREMVFVHTKEIVTVTTSSDTTMVLINGEEAKRGKKDKNTGLITWRMTLVPEEIGEYNINVIAYNEGGIASEDLTASILVKNRKKLIENS